MDANKLLKLKEVEYKHQGTCNICLYGDFKEPKNSFGVCLLHEYFHMKHGENRSLSINRNGVCKDVKLENLKMDVNTFIFFDDLK